MWSATCGSQRKATLEILLRTSQLLLPSHLLHIIELGMRTSSGRRQEWSFIWPSPESCTWRQAGVPRVLGYYGPDVPQRERWSEMQIPVLKIADEPQGEE